MIDFGAIGTALLAVFDKLPHIASVVAAGWIFLRVYDYVRYVRPKMMKDAE